MTGGRPIASKRTLLLAVVVFFAALQTAVNAVSRYSDVTGAGHDVAGWMIALDDAASFVAWLFCMVVIWKLVAILRPPRVGWPAAILLHAVATVPVSLLHIGLMVLFRVVAYAALGSGYDFAQGDLAGEILYEYRKDAPVYFLLATAFAAIRWATQERGNDAGAGFLTVQDGSARHSIPVEQIGWAEAAGNYVAIHWQDRQVLHRGTLAALEKRLGRRFARIHRSRIVRREAVRTVETMPSGDFAVTLDDGTEIRGSRRYREALD